MRLFDVKIMIYSAEAMTFGIDQEPMHGDGYIGSELNKIINIFMLTP